MQTDRQKTDRQTYRQTGRQAGRQADRQIGRHYLGSCQQKTGLVQIQKLIDVAVVYFNKT